MDNGSSRSIRRGLWLLYTDANTRFNLLSDECNHLQETILALIPRAKDQLLSRKQAEDSDRNADGLVRPRPWLPPIDIRDEHYYSRRPQERALRNLWVTVGTLGTALEANKAQLRTSFFRAFEDMKVPLGAGADRLSRHSDSVYWFIALRSHYLDAAFPEYLSHIQHAHLKLVTLIENLPGSLPGPTLLRRWSSGSYGELLSAYSRQVNWRTQNLFWRVCRDAGANASTDAEFNDWRSNQYLVHAWAHVPTSRMNVRRLARDATGKAPGPTVTTIWSSYFYLEQPVLFPLLYHECAHQYMESVSLGEAAQTRNPAMSGDRLWFDRAEETIALLRRVATFQPNDQQLWRRVVSEIWVDAISTALCGPAYVFALALQAFGMNGADKTYSDYFTDHNKKIPWDESGRPDRRKLEIEYVTPEDSYVWETRLRLAVRVSRYIFPEKHNGGAAGRALDDFESLLHEWSNSGSIAMHRSRTSREHEDWWVYRQKFNEWLERVVWSQMEDFVNELRLAVRSDSQSHCGSNEYSLDAEIASAINGAVDLYWSNLFPKQVSRPRAAARSVKNTGEPTKTADDLCADIRWELSNAVVELSDSMQSLEEWKATWAFADYMRSDGSAAFRIAHEHLKALIDVVHTIAWIYNKYAKDEHGEVTALKKQLPSHELIFLRELDSAFDQDVKKLHAGVDLIALTNQIFRSPSTILNDAESWPSTSECIERFRSTSASVISGCSKPSPKDVVAGQPGSARLNIGTFTLGVLNPAYIGNKKDNRSETPYSTAFNDLFDHYQEVQRERAKLLGSLPSSSDEALRFYLLFGEYNFAVFENDFTPAEKDVIASSMLPCTIKSRSVLRVNTATRRSGALCRISQVAFRHHWQWVLLSKQLPDNYDMYVSSAWEDVIIVSHHDSHEEMHATSKRLGLRLRKWVDVHSGYALEVGETGLSQARSLDAKAVNYSGERFVSWVRSIVPQSLGSVKEISGRYDALIHWNCHSTGDLLRAFDMLPHEFWWGISGISTSTSHVTNEAVVPDPQPLETLKAAALPPGDSSDAIDFYSQIMQRHDL